MPREKMADKRERAAEIERLMYGHYGEGACSLDYVNPFQLTVAVVLSAQCTDAAVNKVTPALFERYPDADAFAQARIEDIEDIIHPLGFYHSKARNLVNLGRVCQAEFDGRIPNDIDLLQKLPGVGRKTANVVMCEAFRNPQGIAVDTHVFRIAHRLKTRLQQRRQRFIFFQRIIAMMGIVNKKRNFVNCILPTLNDGKQMCKAVIRSPAGAADSVR
jgi:endonuclease-3